MVVPKGAVFNCNFTAVGTVRLLLSATARMLSLFESSRTWWTHPSSWVCIHNHAPHIHFNFFLTKAFIPLMVLVCVPLSVSTKFLEWFSWLSGMYGLNWSEKMTVPGRICVVIRRWTCHSLVWSGRAAPSVIITPLLQIPTDLPRLSLSCTFSWPQTSTHLFPRSSLSLQAWFLHLSFCWNRLLSAHTEHKSQ